MTTLNNFVSSLAGPRGERQWYTTPSVKIFTASDPEDVEDDLNAWLNDLALPVDPANRYSIVDIKYTSAQYSNNTIHFSAFVHYLTWTPV